jgi:hypothetical protein
VTAESVTQSPISVTSLEFDRSNEAAARVAWVRLTGAGQADNLSNITGRKHTAGSLMR